ncbi:hypothetical protein [Bradyrhizobium sp. CCH5-F6]|nr:hypothetical protein [Bradyrhizobium sp. CCH5-F6]
MDFALGLALFIMGAAFGGLVVLALMSDRPRYAEMHSYRDDIEQRSRRVQ